MKILVVEDEDLISENLRALLTFKGYKVFHARDGASAVEIARKELPDLMLLDILLPKLGGFDVCKILKSDAKTKKIKIIMITGLSQMSDVEMAFTHGAADYIIKPFDVDRLFKKLEKVIAMP